MIRLLAPFLVFGLAACATTSRTDDALLERARRLAQESIIIDGHIDVPYRLADGDEDLSVRTDGGDFDAPRARAGGLDAPFMSVYIPSERQETPGAARALADSLIDMVDGFVERWPDHFAHAYSPADVRRNHERGLISVPMGMENGAPIERVEDVRHFFDRGIRYVTLTHGKDNGLSDSSYDTTGTWGGLSPLGRDVVAEMNRVGVMVDVSHLSDDATRDVLEVSRAPVIASHSSARRFTPGWERNMSDELMRAVAQAGGVIMVNFGSSFLKSSYQADGTRIRARLNAYLVRNGLERTDPEAVAYLREQRRANPIGTIGDVADHIDHMVRVAGVDHVGIGSDFDGVWGLPAGLQDVSEYPNLIAELLRRGYSEADVRKILGENLLRVWERVEEVSRD